MPGPPKVQCWLQHRLRPPGRATSFFLSLPTLALVEAVLTGPGGIIDIGGPGIVVDLSTTGPDLIAALAVRLVERGVALLDAPRRGGSTRGKPSRSPSWPTPSEDFRAGRTLLRLFARNVFLVGDTPGEGQLMKLVNKLIAACCVVSFEVLVMGAKADFDAEQMLNVINVSSGRTLSPWKRSQAACSTAIPAGFASELLLEDLKLGPDQAE